jgi:hypothetical protein
VCVCDEYCVCMFDLCVYQVSRRSLSMELSFLSGSVRVCVCVCVCVMSIVYACLICVFIRILYTIYAQTAW